MAKEKKLRSAVRSDHRLEEDSLGSVQVPSDALYGAQTARARDNFQISGRTGHTELIRAYLRLKLAAARANRRAGTLTTEQASLIEKAATQVLKLPVAEWAHHFPIDPYQAGAGTSQNMSANEVIANQANLLAGGKLGHYEPIHPNDHVNRSQSTNDTFPTAMRLALLEASAPLVAETRKLAQLFAKQAKLWTKLPKSARTHLQDAVPMTLGQEFGGHAETLNHCADWIEHSRDELRALGIGGSAAGTGLNAPSAYRKAIIEELTKLTGEKLSSAPNLVWAMQSQSAVMHYSGSLRLLALELTRICNDLRLLASGPLTGLAEILLPAVQPGSSIMPGKVNPSILEMANQTWYSVLGYDHAVAGCVQAGQLELNVMMPMMAYSLLEATHVATRGLATLRERSIEGLTPNTEKLRHYFESTPQVATALSPRLGYEATAKLVQQSLKEGKSVLALVREKKLIPEKELKALLDIEKLTGQA